MNRRAARVPTIRGAAATVVAGIVSLTADAALAEPRDDPRLRVLDYQPGVVLPLTAFLGYHVHVEFAPGEFFVSLGAGDTSSLDVGSEGNHLLLKPRQPNAGTNLTILTNRRTYFVDYRALARPPRPDEAVYSIVFRYPDAPPSAAAAPAGVDPPERLLDAPRPDLNRNYWYCGSASLRPIAAVDDGLQLRLTFAPHVELPAVFAAEPDGEETLVNTHVERDNIVVHRLVQRLVLRRGLEVGCVVDRSVRTMGQRAATGTVDSGVDRQTREATK